MDSAKNLLLSLTCLVFSTLTFSLDVFNAWGSFSKRSTAGIALFPTAFEVSTA